MALEVIIDEGACMSSGECSFFAPGVFDNREDGVAFVKDPAGEPEDKVIQAARRCPNFAIAVVKDGVKLV